MVALKFFHIAFEGWAVLFCIIAIICVHATRHYDRQRAWGLKLLFLIEIAVLISDIYAWAYKGVLSDTAYWGVRLSNFFVFFFSSVLGSASTYYIVQLLKKRANADIGKWEIFVYVETILSLVILLFSQFYGFYYFFDSQNDYHRNVLFPLFMVLATVPMLVSVICVLRYFKAFKKIERVIYILTLAFPVAAIIIQTFFYGISFINVATTASFILVFVAYELEYAMQMSVRERERAEEKIKMYQHQIQPHFIFNCLTLLRSMCVDNPEAREAITHFSGFLRSSVDSLSEQECISFESELKTVEDYLYMQQKRFGIGLEVEYDIKATNFFLPSFSIQLLVENSIRHGIRGREDGSGKISIRSYKKDRDYVAEVYDDGKGFDTKEVFKGEHAGLKNIRERLDFMCGGRLEILSPFDDKGGTLARIYVPEIPEGRVV